MRANLKTFTILLLVTVLYIVFRYQGGALFFLKQFHPQLANRSVATLAVYYQWCMAFLILGVVPAMVARFGFKEKLTQYGIAMKRPLVTIFITLIGVVIVTPLTYIGANDTVLSTAYPLVKSSGSSPSRFFESSVFYILYYIGYEFCFRGFLFMGIKEDVGEWQAVGISLLATVLLHVNRPQSETVMAIVAGIVFPIVVSRLGSLFPVIIVHAYTGIALDYWIIVRAGGF